MDNLYMKGELLQVHTKNCEIFEGRFYDISKDKSKISLYEVKELPQGNLSDGVLHYYNTEIRDIVKLHDPRINKVLKISQKECEDIIRVSKRYIYLNQVDNAFHEAIVHLDQYNYIAVSTDGAFMGRKCKMPFIVASTPERIYIFDTQSMQHHAFDAGLKKLLESKTPKKIVHDCRLLSDCLFHKHNVRLKSVFDTQVGDVIIMKNKNGFTNKVKTLSECLNSYLGLQEDTVDEKLDIIQITERPLASNIKGALAKNIAFLHRLSEIINEEMKMPFYRGIECYIENIRSCDDFKAWELCRKQNQLPEDFKRIIEY